VHGSLGQCYFTIAPTGIETPPVELGSGRKDLRHSRAPAFPRRTRRFLGGLAGGLCATAGNGFVPAPTPNIPALAGLTFYFQGIRIEDVASGQACGPSPFHLTSTRGLSLTVQP
jgi:hypothetical protein